MPKTPLRPLLSDTELLNRLQALPLASPEQGWKLRPSTTGRGWRLMTTTEIPNYSDVREALQAGLRSAPTEES